MIPLNKNKWNSKALFSPEDYLKSIKKQRTLSTTKVLYLYQGFLAAELLKNQIVQKTEEGLVYQEDNQSVLVVLSPGIGAPAAIIGLEELWAQGIRQVVTFGSAGAMIPTAAIGDCFWVSQSLRDEGTSYHYLPVDPNLSQKNPEENWIGPTKVLFQKLASEMGWPSVKGWTTDAPYRETIAEIEVHRANGVAVVEMEISAVYAWAQFRGVQAVSAVSVSDILTTPTWQPAFQSDKLRQSLIEGAKDILSAFCLFE